MSNLAAFCLLCCFVNLLAPAVLGADVVIRDQIDVAYDQGTRVGTEVDHWYFRNNSEGRVKIDTLAYEAYSGFNERPVITQDLNEDGELTVVDTYIYLFHNDGFLDPTDEIARNDNGSGTFGDGSVRVEDAVLSLTLPPGDYILAIGAYVLTVEDAIAGVNDDPFRGGFIYPLTVTDSLGGNAYGDFIPSEHADYQITFSGDVELQWVGAGKTIFPQAVFGGGWETALSVANPDPFHSTEILVRAYDKDGMELKREEAVLGPKTTRRFSFTGSSSQPVSGFVVVEHNREVAASMRYEGRDGDGDILESVGVIPNRDLIAHNGFTLDVVYDTRVDTGIALVPDAFAGTDTSEVGVSIYDDSGTRIGETTITIENHYSKFVSEIFPDLPKPFHGYLQVQHGGSFDTVHAIALMIEYRSNGWELTSLPLHPQD